MKRSKEQKEAHQEHAKALLDMGLRKADVAATLQRKYALSRATSYRDVDEADISREGEDHRIEADPTPEITWRIEHDADDEAASDRCFEKGNVGTMHGCREYERLARMGGLSHKF